MTIEITSDQVDLRIEQSARSIISILNENGLFPLLERVEVLEEVCSQLLEENNRLRERVRRLEAAVDEEDGETEILTERPRPRGNDAESTENLVNGV